MGSVFQIGCGSNRAWLKTLVILGLAWGMLATVFFSSATVWFTVTDSDTFWVFEKKVGATLLLSTVPAVWIPVRDNEALFGVDFNTLVFAGFLLATAWSALGVMFYIVALCAEKSPGVRHGLWACWSHYLKLCLFLRVGFFVVAVVAVEVSDSSFNASKAHTVPVRVVKLAYVLFYDAFLLLVTKARYLEKVMAETENEEVKEA